MEDFLIDIYVAKIAKKKGFEIISENFYCENYIGLCTEHEEFLIVQSLDNPIYDCNNEFGEGERYYAPTQSLLQRWLREVHNIDVIVLPIRFTGREEIGYWTYAVKSIQPVGKERYKYDRYEDALNIGLVKGLELI